MTAGVHYVGEWEVNLRCLHVAFLIESGGEGAICPHPPIDDACTGTRLRGRGGN